MWAGWREQHKGECRMLGPEPVGCQGEGREQLAGTQGERTFYGESCLNQSCGLWTPASWLWNCLERTGKNIPTLPSSLPNQPRLKNGRTHRCGPCGPGFWRRKQGGEWVWRAKRKIPAPSFPSCCSNIPLLHVNSCREMKQSHFYLHLLQARNVISFFLLILFYWSIVNLQCCVNICCTAKWFSYTRNVISKQDFQYWIPWQTPNWVHILSFTHAFLRTCSETGSTVSAPASHRVEPLNIYATDFLVPPTMKIVLPSLSQARFLFCKFGVRCFKNTHLSMPRKTQK